jgi:peptidoglycan/xylan/chitin deacetylase (PgdA/CDA1 family)
MTAVDQLVYLMYHELELPGRGLCDSDPGYVRYVVSESDFKSQMNWLKEQGWKGHSVKQALSSATPPAVVITFDDGAETDLVTAAPILKNAGFGATFYITTGFLRKLGYLTHSQVRELADLGFDIGCHSATHPFLSDLSGQRLSAEILDPKLQLEQIIGRAVENFSCPGGRWNSRVAEITRRSGYRSMATSQTRANSSNTDSFCLGRVAIMRGTRLPAFQNVCSGRGLWKLQMAELARASAKSVLGNGGYDRLRTFLLHRSASRQ